MLVGQCRCVTSPLIRTPEVIRRHKKSAAVGRVIDEFHERESMYRIAAETTCPAYAFRNLFNRIHQCSHGRWEKGICSNRIGRNGMLLLMTLIRIAISRVRKCRFCLTSSDFTFCKTPCLSVFLCTYDEHVHLGLSRLVSQQWRAQVFAAV